MAIEQVRPYLTRFGLADRIQEFSVSSATVELAAQAVGVIPARIAKTLSFRQGEGCLLVVAAGDVKIDNTKFKARFGVKATMLSPDQVTSLLGQTIGGVCPFNVDAAVPIYLDESLRRFSSVFPACGSANSAIELTCDELLHVSRAQGWVDVCKLPEA